MACCAFVQTVEVEQSWVEYASVYFLFPVSVLSGHSIMGEYMREYTESVL